jgi:GNAT superfamily N-acetyltransferase
VNIEPKMVGVEFASKIAYVHIAAFPERALILLGLEAVCRFYESVGGGEGVWMFGTFDKGRLIGHGVCGHTGGAHGRFVAHQMMYLTGRLIKRPWLLFMPVIRKRICRLLRPTRAEKNVSDVPVFRGMAAVAIPGIQGKGVGKLLMASAEEVASKNGYEEIGLSVASGITRVLMFYGSLGWRMAADAKEWCQMVKWLN